MPPLARGGAPTRGDTEVTRAKPMTPFVGEGHDPSVRPSLKNQRPTGSAPAEPDVTASVIARGMTLVGDCRSEGTIRIEGRVEGDVRSAKAIVIGKDGVVIGDVIARDTIISGAGSGRGDAQYGSGRSEVDDEGHFRDSGTWYRAGKA